MSGAKSSTAGTGLEGNGESDLEIEQTDVNGFWHTDCTRISKQGGDFYFMQMSS